jgi:hypothetical protein
MPAKFPRTSGYPLKKRKTEDRKPQGRRAVGPLAPSLLKFDRNNSIFILSNWASDKRRKIQNQRTYEQEHVLQCLPTTCDHIWFITQQRGRASSALQEELIGMSGR